MFSNISKLGNVFVGLIMTACQHSQSLFQDFSLCGHLLIMQRKGNRGYYSFELLESWAIGINRSVLVFQWGYFHKSASGRHDILCDHTTSASAYFTYVLSSAIKISSSNGDHTVSVLLVVPTWVVATYPLRLVCLHICIYRVFCAPFPKHTQTSKKNLGKSCTIAQQVLLDTYLVDSHQGVYQQASSLDTKRTIMLKKIVIKISSFISMIS